MNRTARRKIQYLAAFLAIGALVAALWRGLDLGSVGLAVLALVLMIPGRLHGVLWRELYRGRARLERGKPHEALAELQRFLERLDRHPRLRRLWWLAWATYTRDGRALALNSIGAAHLELGDLESAEASFRSALELDPEYPIPYANLAALAKARGDAGLAAEHTARARELGLSGGATDRLLRRAGSALARVEGSL